MMHLPIYSITCGDCTKCCEGWLEGVVHGYKMYRGCSCHFLEKSCSAYESRPENPCKSYNCAWLLEDKFPSWMKPSLSGVIITKLMMKIPTNNGMNQVEYYNVTETNSKIDSSVLNWLIHWALDSDINLVYELEGKIHAIGKQEFKALIS